ncbi:MAG: endonuclease/exonuclease/phosphatase family protein [Cyclobacteriaceae bacterium]|nr:endonuclease/exonuclease/phosphatase family protein [Cyclobacteriaceae bacterium]
MPRENLIAMRIATFSSKLIILLLVLHSAFIQTCQVAPPQRPEKPSADTVAQKPDTVVSLPTPIPIPIDSVVILPDTVPDIHEKSITICSFNIQFLGHFKKKDHAALANLLKPYDIVVIQELVAPPVSGTYPDGTAFSADPEARAFLDAMTFHGFSYALSDEDTGPVETIHTNNTSTEWWIVFYKDTFVDIASDLPHGFLASDRSANPDFERVPYAFPFRMDGKDTDFVLIPVHLAPNASASAKRQSELAAIQNWIDANDEAENDFIVLGDMNIEDAEELAEITPSGFISLNNECYRTNTLQNNTANGGAKPYDHVIYRPAFTSEEIDEVFDIKVLNLIDSMKTSWTGSAPYPGNPYNHNEFKQYYSDHHPVIFRIVE